MAPLCGTSHDARWWLCTDCCGLSCALFAQGVIFFAQYVISSELAGRNSVASAVQATVFNAFAGLALASHLRAMLSDPGAVPKGAEPLARDSERAKLAASAAAGYRTRAKGWCHRCGSYKPPRAHHDSVTGRCIIKLDHYCPWTNNAIGVRNHKFFLLFIWYVFLMCAHALLVVCGLAVDALNNHPEQTPGVAACAVAVFAVLFGLFTACMLCDQWTVLSTNVAKIDRLKGDPDDQEVSSGVNEIFGGKSHGFRLDWLLPTAPRFPQSVHDDIMGYQAVPPPPVVVDHQVAEAAASSPLLKTTSKGGSTEADICKVSDIESPARSGLERPAPRRP
ncbi:hypothetical protein CTAYLR_004852 [Chrysophaeum taylorii]|uniref:Palmitoyltransferase n=1 Tax=Chrysophaeum taylorii TaxID=2483200 RepID=A0AAD7UEX9_9STRA|nr:hypothetical protein CTAYLR_004852 [Chrysophaeum taylorii]